MPVTGLTRMCGIVEDPRLGAFLGRFGGRTCGSFGESGPAIHSHRVRIIWGPNYRNPVQEHPRPGYSHKTIIIPPTGSFRGDFDGAAMQPATQTGYM